MRTIHGHDDHLGHMLKDFQSKFVPRTIEAPYEICLQPVAFGKNIFEIVKNMSDLGQSPKVTVTLRNIFMYRLVDCIYM